MWDLASGGEFADCNQVKRFPWAKHVGDLQQCKCPHLEPGLGLSLLGYRRNMANAL